MDQQRPGPAVGRRGAKQRRWVLAWLGLAAGTIAVALTVGAVPVALVAAEPPAGGRIAGGPTAVTLTFSGAVDPARTHVRVTGPAGEDVTAGPPEVVGPTVVQPVGPIRAGVVAVTYHAVLTDGQELADWHQFAIGPGAEPALAPPAGGHRHGDGLLTTGVAVLVLAAGIAVMVVGVRRRGPSGD